MNEIVSVASMETTAIMPIMGIAQAVRRKAIVEFVKSIMEPGTDYGRVPGTNKDTLLKPGAEKLTTFFGLSPHFEIQEKDLDWTGEGHGHEPFFYFQYLCSLYRGPQLIGQGIGSCNSWEKKYRYRNAQLKCPQCGEETIKRSKYPPQGRPNDEPGWYCFAKIGGCGVNYDFNHPDIQNQERGKVVNDNPADIVNTLDKMAQKRALVAATLIAVNASEFFTQDLEDMDIGPIVEGEIVVEKPKSSGPDVVAKTNEEILGHDGTAEAQANTTKSKPVRKPKPNGNGNGNGNIDWKAKLMKGRHTLSTVCSIAANGIPTINSPEHALEVLKKHYQLPEDLADGWKWEMGQGVTQKFAVLMYDFIDEHEKAKAG